MLSIQELRIMKRDELLDELKKAQMELTKLRIGVKTSHQKDTNLVTKGKKYVARIKTLVKELDMEDMVKKAAEIA